jgi:hypothetical protein
LMRAIRLFIAEGEGRGSEASVAPDRRQGPVAAEEKQKGSVTYQMSEQPAVMVREEEFAKQLRLARYLAGASLPPSRPLEPASEARAPEPARRAAKSRSRAKKQSESKRLGRRN